MISIKLKAPQPNIYTLKCPQSMPFLNLIFGPLPKAIHIYWWQIQKAHCLKFSKMVWKSDVPVKLTELWAFKHQTQIAPLGQKYKLQIHKSKKLHNCHELAESDQAGYEISHSQWQYLSQFKYLKKFNVTLEKDLIPPIMCNQCPYFSWAIECYHI